MNQLTILSRDADIYNKLLKDADLPNLAVVQVTSEPDDIETDRTQILLSEPDLAIQVLEKCEHLQWLQSTWAGNAPLIQHPKRDYQLTAVKGIFSRTMREYVAAYILHFSRNIDAFHPRIGGGALNKPIEWCPPRVGALAGKCLGVLGAGEIGASLIDFAHCFDMRIIGLNRSGDSDYPFDALYSAQQAQAFAEQCDYLVCLLPDTPATNGFVDATFLSQLKQDCVLINAGRGNSLQQQALLDALDNGHLKAAVLDVFETEPLPTAHPFWHHDKVWVTQHTAAISDPVDVLRVFADNYHRWHQQQPLMYQVNFEQGY